MTRDLFQDYLANRPELMTFYGMTPRMFRSSPSAAPSDWDAELASEVLAYHREIGGNPDILLRGREQVIATGQQPGLLGGPLYSILKAASAIRVSEYLRQWTGTPTIPVFWVAEDDHDFEEAHRVGLLGKDFDVLPLEYAPEENIHGFPLRNIPVAESLHTLVEQSAAAVRGSEHRAGVTQFLHDSLDQSTSFSEWFSRIMARLFRDTPLLFFSPHLPRARRLAGDMIYAEIDTPAHSSYLINEAGARLRELGYRPQIVKDATECGFFMEMGLRRRKVLWTGSSFFIPEESIHCGESDIRDLMDIAPDRFSPNVALRCVVQQRLLPVTAYVAGPGEVAYWAQLKPLFDWHGLPMPCVYPRARACLLPPQITKLLDRYQLSIGDFPVSEDALTERLMAAESAHGARAAIQEATLSMEADLTSLAARVEHESVQAAAQLRAGMRRLQGELAGAERTVLLADEKRTDTARQRARRMINTISPGGQPQERMISVFSFLFEYGWDLVPHLISNIDPTYPNLAEMRL